jgi:hypothetical protein
MQTTWPDLLIEVDLVVLPTTEAIAVLTKTHTNAILHLTC